MRADFAASVPLRLSSRARQREGATPMAFAAVMYTPVGMAMGVAARPGGYFILFHVWFGGKQGRVRVAMDSDGKGYAPGCVQHRSPSAHVLPG